MRSLRNGRSIQPKTTPISTLTSVSKYNSNRKNTTNNTTSRWLVIFILSNILVYCCCSSVAASSAELQQQEQQQKESVTIPSRSLLRSSSSSSKQRNLIIGGYQAAKDRYPYYVSLLDANDEIQCGGTLIAPDIVLTAAHCKGSNLKHALVGKYTNLEDDGHERIEILNPYTDLSVEILESSGKAKLDNSGFIHPDHDHVERTYDIMLMKLERAASSVHTQTLMKINMNPNRPVKEEDPPSVNEITVIGMGNTDVSGTSDKPDTLQQVHLNYLPYEQCIDSEGYSLDYKFELLPHMICTQGAGIYGNRGQCYGDSGGPYIVLGDSPEEDVQVGVVSWAVNCASAVFPMVGSRTSASVGFIRDVTCAVSIDPPSYLCDANVLVYSNNNQVQTRVDVQTGVSISVRIYSDPYGHELSWIITDQLDINTVYAEAPYGRIVGDHTFTTVQVPVGADLRFEIKDAADDGIFGDPDAILYEIVLNDRGDELVMVEGNGQFTTSRVETFRVPNSNEYEALFASRFSSYEETALDLDRSGGRTVPFFIDLEFDDYHEDASWEVTSSDGSQVFGSKGPNEYRFGTSITEQVNLPSGKYLFTIKDRRGTDDLRAFKSYHLYYEGGLYNSGKTEIYRSEPPLRFTGETASHEFEISVIGGVTDSQPAIVIEDSQALDMTSTQLRRVSCSSCNLYCVSNDDCCSGLRCSQGSRCTGSSDCSTNTGGRERASLKLSGRNGGSARNWGTRQ